MSMEEWVGPAYGRRLDSGWPEGTLAILDTQWEAKPKRVEAARYYFPEVDLADFEPVGTLGRKFRRIADGAVFRLVEHQVLEHPDPPSTGVTAFAIAGWRIVFLRPITSDPEPGRGLQEAVVARRLS